MFLEQAMAFAMDPALAALLQQHMTGGGQGADPDSGFLPDGRDPKTALNTFCQRATKKAIGKTDIVYTSQKIGQVYQAVVRLNCMDGVEFAGETALTQKDAEKNAATQALSHYPAQLAEAPVGKNSKKRKTPGSDPVLDGLIPGSAADAAPVVNSRMRLNAGVMRIVHKALNKDDIVYNTVQTALGYQCTISVPCLPGEWGTFAWAGEVDNKKKQAEENAAGHALNALRADPGMCASLDTPTVKKLNPGKWFGSKGGGGKGFGKGYGCGGGGGKGWFK